MYKAEIEKRLKAIEIKKNIIKAEPSRDDLARLTIGTATLEYCDLGVLKATTNHPRYSGSRSSREQDSSSIDSLIETVNVWKKKLGEREFAKRFPASSTIQNKTTESKQYESAPMSSAMIALQLATKKVEGGKALH